MAHAETSACANVSAVEPLASFADLVATAGQAHSGAV
jgi:hypothetical protein